MLIAKGFTVYPWHGARPSIVHAWGQIREFQRREAMGNGVTTPAPSAPGCV